jgi:hypothetical protein
MTPKLEYDPTQYTAKVNQLIMLKAEQWQCPPGQALMRLLDEVAKKELKPTTKSAA